MDGRKTRGGFLERKDTILSAIDTVLYVYKDEYYKIHGPKEFAI